MRIIAGSGKGRRLKSLEGMSTRPTTDRVKESIFNIIQFDIEGREVLDLFAGTGQLGIEALSRGAAHATFLDQKTEAVRVIRENLAAAGYERQATVLQGDALAYLSGCARKFGLIFLDPPYAGGLLKKALENIARFDILSDGGIIVCETSAQEGSLSLSVPYIHIRDYHYGKTRISLYGRQ